MRFPKKINIAVTTVGDLIETLKLFPPNTVLVIDGADSGGYDMAYCKEAVVRTHDQVFHPDNSHGKTFPKNVVFIGGFEPY